MLVASPTEVSPQVDQPKTRMLSGFFVPRVWWGAVVNLVFPPRCANCGRVDYQWCPQCSERLLQTPLVAKYRDDLSTLAGCVSSGVHEGILRQALHALKYENTRQVAPLLGARLALCLLETEWIIDTVIPVPLHTTRLKERGYNQAKLIAEGLTGRTALTMSEDGLQRQRFTHTQVGLNREERLENVVDAFIADSFRVRGQRVLIIDDVCTTGATLEACASALLSAGAEAVYALTVTRAQDFAHA